MANRKGRALKYTADEVIEAIEDSRGILTVAAKKLGCSRPTLYSYIKRYKSVKQALDASIETTLDHAEIRLFALVDNAKHKDHFSAVRYLLRTKGKERGYVERQEIAGVSEQPITLNFIPAQKPDDM